jgi:hypothetical protein
MRPFPPDTAPFEPMNRASIPFAHRRPSGGMAARVVAVRLAAPLPKGGED